MLLKLVRTQRTDTFTLGTLSGADSSFATMELPWKDYAQDVSCVPPGLYELRPVLSPEKGLVYRLHNPQLKVIGFGEVPAGCRFGVEMHPGNWARDSKGCILIGRRAGELTDPTIGVLMPAVLESDNAMIHLRRLLGTAVTHTLAVENGESSCKPSAISLAGTKKA